MGKRRRLHVHDFEIGDAAHPDWAGHFLDATPLNALVGKFGSGVIEINVWSDCGGYASEMFAGKQLALRALEKFGLNIEFKLHHYCDKDATCLQFASDVHAPRFTSNDIYGRDFGSGLVHNGATMPRQGIDLYVCGFPCGPWSKRGKRLKFEDTNSTVIWQAIKSIRFMKPSMFMLENVVGITQQNNSDGKASDMSAISQFAEEHISEYDCVVVTGICPTSEGYPLRRSRVLILGGERFFIFFK
jgi:site-specific DNA-cytosine methylase